MLVLAVILLAVIGAMVLAAAASGGSRSLTAAVVVGGVLVVLVVLLGGAGLVLRGGDVGEHDVDDATPADVTTPSTVAPVAPVEVRPVDLVVRPNGRRQPLDHLPDVGTRLILVRSDHVIFLRQCVVDGPCEPGIPTASDDGLAVALVELRRTIGDVDCAVAPCSLDVTRAGSGRPVATVPLYFGEAAPPPPPPEPPEPTAPALHADLDGRQLAAGLTGAALLIAIGLWLLRRRPDEEPEDPFWGVSLEVPEWEGIDLDVEPDDELASA